MRETSISSGQPLGLTDNRPWPGPLFYTEADSRFFCGREIEAVELHRLVRAEPLAVLFGISGLGKTSLLNAGLVPRLRAVGWLPVLLQRLDFDVPLAEQVLEAAARSANEAGFVVPRWKKGDTLWKAFHRRGQLFWGLETEPATPVLIFDQFEDCFTLGQAGGVRHNTTDFLAQLSDLVENNVPLESNARGDEANAFTAEAVPLRVILSLREDYLAPLEALNHLFCGLRRARLRLLPFTAMQARIVVECPNASLLAPGAADAILDTFLSFAVDGTDATVDPALLSLFCWHLNEQRIAAGLEHLEAERIVGSRDCILREFYISAFADLENYEAVQCWVENSLVDADGYRASRSWGDALATSGVTKSALDTLIKRRLLHPFDRPGAPTQLELTHDRLCEVVVKNREVRRAATNKAETDKLRRQLQRSRLTVVLMVVLVVFAATAAIYAFHQRRSAREAAKEATVSLARAEKAVEQMTSSLKEELEPLGYLGILEEPIKKLIPLYDKRRDDLEYERHRGTLLHEIGQIYFTTGRLPEAFSSYGKSLTIRQTLLRMHEADTNCQQQVADSLTAIGDACFVVGQLDRALSSYDEALKIRSRLKDTLKAQPEMTERFAQCLFIFGDLLKTLGRFEEAQKRYDEGLTLFQEVFKKTGSKENKRALASGVCTYGDMFRVRGMTSEALKNYNRSKQYRQELVDSEPNNIYYQNELAVSWACLGDIHRTVGRLDYAKDDYGKALAIREHLRTVAPQNVFFIRDYTISLSDIGDVYLAKGELQSALDKYEESLRYRRQNSTSNDLSLLAEVAIGLENKGDALMALDRPEDALKAYHESLEIRKKIATKEPDDINRAAEVARSFAKHADALLKCNTTNDAGAAVEDYRASVRKYEDLATREPSNVSLQVDLAVSRGNLGEGLLCLGKLEEALKLLRDSQSSLEKRMLVDSDNIQLAQSVAHALLRIGRAELARGERTNAQAALDQGLAILDSRWDKLDFYGRRWRENIVVERTTVGF